MVLGVSRVVLLDLVELFLDVLELVGKREEAEFSPPALDDLELILPRERSPNVVVIGGINVY
jgi:hypothetical protein